VKTVSVGTYTDDPMAVLSLAEKGEEAVILRDAKPVAKIVRAATEEDREKRAFPTPEEIQHHWENYKPIGKMSPVTGAEIVDWARGEQ
jgi:antitoxin (DNA-binding transcriptional repressor) of toxin-antitoxin stability system